MSLALINLSSKHQNNKSRDFIQHILTQQQFSDQLQFKKKKQILSGLHFSPRWIGEEHGSSSLFCIHTANQSMTTNLISTVRVNKSFKYLPTNHINQERYSVKIKPDGIFTRFQLERKTEKLFQAQQRLKVNCEKKNFNWTREAKHSDGF